MSFGMTANEERLYETGWPEPLCDICLADDPDINQAAEPEKYVNGKYYCYDHYYECPSCRCVCPECEPDDPACRSMETNEGDGGCFNCGCDPSPETPWFDTAGLHAPGRIY